MSLTFTAGSVSGGDDFSKIFGWVESGVLIILYGEGVGGSSLEMLL